ncbi:DNA alkylation repair protein [Candidatus Saccharibacteria bacterium]|nr:DNA alkylation repair protein [Candidatus Saccharibacteria bacterium]
MQQIQAIQQQLRDQSDPIKAEFFPHFFTSEPGDKDEFLGVTVPKQRTIVAKFYKKINPVDVLELLHSNVHEERLTALLIWVAQYQHGEDKTKKQVYDLYLRNRKWVNNWDLVDSSAHKIVGDWLIRQMEVGNDDRSILQKLSKSSSVWDRRIAMMATFTFIRRDDYSWTIRLAEQYLDDQHHYIQKVSGWMLREVGKRDQQTLLDFLDIFAAKMPRIMLRYSLEKLDKQQRTHYLSLK